MQNSNSNQEILDHQLFSSPNVCLHASCSHPVSLAEDLSSRLQNNQTKKKQKLGKGTVVGEEKKKVQFVNFTEKHIASEKKIRLSLCEKFKEITLRVKHRIWLSLCV